MLPTGKVTGAYAWLLVLLCYLVGESPSASAEAFQQKIDLRLLVDSAAIAAAASGATDGDAGESGSGAKALELVAQLLPAGSRAGIWLYSGEVTELVPHGVVNEQWRRAAGKAVEDFVRNVDEQHNPGEAIIDAESATPETARYRGIPGALSAALFDADKPNPDYRTHLVLLSGRRLNVAASPVLNASAARDILEDVIPRLTDLGISVYTIAFSQLADESFLQSLAQGTGGVALEVSPSSPLPAQLFKVIERVTPLQRLPLQRRHFDVNGEVDEMIVLFQGAGLSGNVLAGPGGFVNAGSTSPATDGFLSLQIPGPQSGSWKLLTPVETHGTVIIHAGLELQVADLPGGRVQTGQGQELRLRLSEHGLVVDDGARLDAMDISIAIFGPAQFHQRIPSNELKPQAGGELVANLPPLPKAGEYRIEINYNVEGSHRKVVLFRHPLGAAGQATLVTRGETPDQDDFRMPFLVLGGSILVALGVLWFVLHRRKQRKLAVWRKRADTLRSHGDAGMFRTNDSGDRTD